MAAGDILNPKRPRYQANERFDVVDAEAASVAPRRLVDTFMKATLLSPPAVAASATGLIFTGCGLTANPTGATDGRVRVQSNLAVALDADGRFLVKPVGTTLDVAVPVGTSQVYLYYVEGSTDSAVRRFISITSPFAESPGVTDTAWQGNVGVFLRTGSAGSIVASDVIGGVTTALVFIGLATNSSGVITLDTSNTNNRLSTVRAVPTSPPDAVSNGSARTLHDLLLQALYQESQTKFRDVRNHNLPSLATPPAAVNNYGAYTQARRGLDAVDRDGEGLVTIGDGSTTFGTFDRTEFASDDLLVQAALNLVVAQGGGRILLKSNVILNNFAGDMLLSTANNVRVEFVGQNGHFNSTATAQLQLGSRKIVQDVTTLGPGTLAIRNLVVTASGTGFSIASSVELQDCCFYNLLSMTPMFVSTATISNMSVRGCSFQSSTSGGTVQVGIFAFMDLSGFSVNSTAFRECSFSVAGLARSGISALVGASVRFIDCDFNYTTANSGSEIGATIPTQACWLKLISADNTIITQGRLIRGCTFSGGNGPAGDYVACWFNQSDLWTVVENTFRRCKFALGFTRTSGTYNFGFTIHSNRFMGARADGSVPSTNALYGVLAVNAGFSNCHIDKNKFFGTRNYVTDTSGAAIVADTSLSGNTFTTIGAQAVTETYWQVQGSYVNFSADGNTWRGGSVDGFTSILFQGTAFITNVSFCNNNIYGFYNTTTADANVGVRFNSGQIQSISANGNHFDNINNDTVYTASASGNPRLMEFNATYINDVSVSNNTGASVNVMTTRSGSGPGTQGSLHVAHFSGVDRTSSALTLANVNVDNNVFAQDNVNCYLTLCYVADVAGPMFALLGSLSVSGNRLSTCSNMVSLFPSYGVGDSGLCFIYLQSGTYNVQAGHIHIKNNNVWMRGVQSTVQLASAIFLATNGATGSMRLGGIHICDNSFEGFNGTWSVQGGIYVQADFAVWVFQNNTASRLGVATVLTMLVTLGFSYNDTNRQLPVIPASGSNFTNCIGIQRA